MEGGIGVIAGAWGDMLNGLGRELLNGLNGLLSLPESGKTVESRGPAPGKVEG